jgi:hemerythrin
MFDTAWKQKYETGHARIDFEHRVFLDLIDQFASEAANSEPSRRLVRLCAELYKYADFHFFSEEGLMEDAGYAGLTQHHKLHAELLSSLRTFIESVSLDHFMVNQMVDFLITWFVTHTTSEDVKFTAKVK